MRKATTAHNPDRVIAHSLDGPVYAPDDWSDEQVSLFKAKCASSCSASHFFHLGGCSGHAGQSIGLLPRSEWAGQRSLAPAEYRWPSEPLFAPQDYRYCTRHPLAKPLQTKKSHKNFSYRISMVVVAVAMVVLLRALVNRRPQHGGAA